MEGQTTSVELGPFQESIRTYLLGETGFPEGVYVLVGACEDKGSRGMVFAPSLVNRFAQPECSLYLCVGNLSSTSSLTRAPRRMQKNSVVSSRIKRCFIWRIATNAFFTPAVTSIRRRGFRRM